MVFGFLGNAVRGVGNAAAGAVRGYGNIRQGYEDLLRPPDEDEEERREAEEERREAEEQRRKWKDKEMRVDRIRQDHERAKTPEHKAKILERGAEMGLSSDDLIRAVSPRSKKKPEWLELLGDEELLSKYPGLEESLLERGTSGHYETKQEKADATTARTRNDIKFKNYQRGVRQDQQDRVRKQKMENQDRQLRTSFQFLDRGNLSDKETGVFLNNAYRVRFQSDPPKGKDGKSINWASGSKDYNSAVLNDLGVAVDGGLIDKDTADLMIKSHLERSTGHVSMPAAELESHSKVMAELAKSRNTPGGAKRYQEAVVAFAELHKSLYGIDIDVDAIRNAPVESFMTGTAEAPPQPFDAAMGAISDEEKAQAHYEQQKKRKALYEEGEGEGINIPDETIESTRELAAEAGRRRSNAVDRAQGRLEGVSKEVQDMWNEDLPEDDFEDDPEVAELESKLQVQKAVRKASPETKAAIKKMIEDGVPYSEIIKGKEVQALLR